MFINAVLKNKFAKYKQVFDETLLSLFLHRCKALCLLQTIEMNNSEVNYLESKDILDHVLEAPSKNPTLFLNSVETYFGIEFASDFAKQFRQDNFALINKGQPTTTNDFK
jgi:hypothetical protein